MENLPCHIGVLGLSLKLSIKNGELPSGPRSGAPQNFWESKRICFLPLVVDGEATAPPAPLLRRG